MLLKERLLFSRKNAFAGQALELRRNYLNVISAVALVILTAALLRAAAWRVSPVLFHTWQVVAVLAAGMLATSALKDRSIRLASWVMILTLMLANITEMLLFPHSRALLLFAVIGVAAALLHSERGAALLIAVNLICILALGIYHAPLLAVQEVLWPAFIVLMVSVTAWLGTHQLYTVLQWEWHSTQQSLSMAREAQDHRAELMHLNKELDGAYIRLERMNRMLILARKEAGEATALKMQFANTVSHELRSPINMILGFSDMMVNSPEVYGPQPWDPRLRQHIHQIYQSSQHLSQLIDDVLDMARIDAYRLTLVKAPAQIEDVIAETCDIARTLFEARHLYLRMQVEPGLPFVSLDQTRIRQVLLNLLTNAVRFTREGGVTIRAFLGSTARGLSSDSPAAQTPEASLVISVTDTGIGIDKADLPKLFQEFGQLENVYRWSRGAGLGLFISKQLIELHGGQIWAESEPGSGTTFFLSLPMQPTGAMAAHSAPSRQEEAFWAGLEQKARERRTLLVLGDDPRIRRLLTVELSDFDLNWLPADCPEPDWLQVAAETHSCAIVRMVDGCETASPAPASIVECASGIPFITCSLPGLFEISTPRFLSHYLVKPISRRKLAEALALLEVDRKPIRRLMIVDDDAAMREFLHLAIAHALGQDVALYEAGDGATALALLRQHKPDTVLLDLNLPDMDGLELAERIHHESEHEVRIVAVTARDLQADLCDRQPDMITCVRAKPFSRRELGAILGNMIDGFSAGVTLLPEAVHSAAGQMRKGQMAEQAA